ncbi:amidohydrolase [Paenibacillus albiflavus]|uniref:Amidohydrolase n=1 Tax=Paenibacillus albiflavus TaxID=2545760 RepID=A0A4R4EJ83_9BACL|nr:amidohydrolase family protein [Paenibacillus albiflavus]TCZ80246.1 amidohydrolase [Paenibacillus albiflavus]
MKIIDAHIHLSRIASFQHTADHKSFVTYTSEGLKREFDECGVVLGIGMGVTEQTDGAFPDYTSPNPMPLDLEDELPDFLLECVGINPNLLINDRAEREIQAIELALQKPTTAGIKLYAGYYPYYVYDKVYGPIYELAAQYKVPVVIHTGDTYSPRGLLKYSHPLTVDELAVANRNVNFMICHIGDPWVMDGAEVISKNDNVFGDISGLQVGNQVLFNKFQNEPLYMDHLRRSLVFADRYDKILFGTDWPLAPIDVYINFVKMLVPEQHYEDVFYNNAFRVFPKVQERLGKNNA